MVIKKLKIYLCGNYESYNIRSKVYEYLNKSYSRIITSKRDNYIVNIMKVCEKIREKPDNSVAFFFANNNNNIKALIEQFDTLKINVVTKFNKDRLTTYLNTNILCFSNNEFEESDILKIIKTFLYSYNEKKMFY